MIEIYFCSDCGFPLGEVSLEKFKKIFSKIKEAQRNIFPSVLKGYADPRFIFVFINVECPKCKKNVKASFYSRFFSDSPKIILKEFYLVDIYPTIFENLDGIYSRVYIRNLLEMFIKRWSYISLKTIIHSPFIGPFPFTKQDKTEDWRWILKKTNPYNLLIITRKTHANYLKKLPFYSLEETEGSNGNSTDWFNSLIKAYSKEDIDDVVLEGIMKPLFAEKSLHVFNESHAKFYAGVINGYVEAIITSYNIFQPGPKYGETFTIIKYTYEFFYEKFLKPLKVPDEHLNIVPEKVLEQDESVQVLIYIEKDNDIEIMQDKCPISKWDIIEKFTRL